MTLFSANILADFYSLHEDVTKAPTKQEPINLAAHSSPANKKAKLRIMDLQPSSFGLINSTLRFPFIKVETWILPWISNLSSSLFKVLNPTSPKLSTKKSESSESVKAPPFFPKLSKIAKCRGYGLQVLVVIRDTTIHCYATGVAGFFIARTCPIKPLYHASISGRMVGPIFSIAF